MGSKSRILLGFMMEYILHFHRNFFNTKIYMSKRIQEKIKEKHYEVFKYTNKDTFKILMKSTIGSSLYKNSKNTINFISYVKDEDKYILYSLKNEKHHVVCNTIFSLRKETLKNYYKDESFKLFDKSFEKILEEYLN